MRSPHLQFAGLAIGILAVLVWSQPADAAQKELVAYRLAKAKTLHLHKENLAKSIHKALKDLGCEVQIKDHDGHFDLVYSCPKWREIEFKTHNEAHKWETWLKKMGFQTRHEH